MLHLHRRLLLLFGLLFAFANTWAHADSWQDASSGQHSFKSLGTEYYVDVPMKKIEHARLVLFNYALARRIGLEVPSDPKQLEKLVLERFAYRTATTGETPDQTYFATRYQDSGSKKEGEALGDGRAVWTGELLLPDSKQANQTRYIDFVMKGVGQTPLAWLNHSDPLHKDGLQSMEEAVHSFIMSEINLRNELDSTADLAVIELPLEKKDKHSGAVEKAALTIRVGNQTRIAHFRYFSDDFDKFKRIFDYCVRRDLGLSQGPIQQKSYRTYVEMLTTNLAEEAARYFDLHAVHSSPTPGNRTTQGSTIDLGTFRYLDAHHVEYTYLFDQLKLKDQTKQLRGYIDWLYYYFYSAEFSDLIKIRKDDAINLFYKSYRAHLTEMWLYRMGLSSSQIQKLKPETRESFYQATESLFEAVADHTVQFGDRKMNPARYDVRFVLKQAVAAHSGKTLDLFSTDRSWGTQSPTTQDARRLESEFDLTIKRVLRELKPDSNEATQMVDRALITNAITRYEPGRRFYLDHEKPVLDSLRGGGSLGANTKLALEAVKHLVDQRLLPRKTFNVGRPERIAVYSGTFDPPHLGHVRVVQSAIENFGLDRVYVVANVASQHKSTAGEYRHRKRMTELAFEGNPNTTTNDKAIEDAFGSDDIHGVFEEVIRRHPGATLYHVMGDDSLNRMKEIPSANVPARTLLISQRQKPDDGESDAPPEALVSQNPVIVITIPTPGEYSSTLIRQAAAEDWASAQSFLPEKVARYVEEHALFSVEQKSSPKPRADCDDLLHPYRWRNAH